MRENVRNLVVGATAIVGVVGLLYLLMMFGSFVQLAQKGYEVSVRLEQASGLARGSQVRLNGIAIGTVRSVELIDPPIDGQFIHLVCLIDEGKRIPRGVTVRVTQPLIGGSPTLAFDMSGLDTDRLADILPTDGTAELRGRSSSLASQFAGELEAALDEPIRLLREVSQSFQRLSAEWEKVGVNVNLLIEQRPLEEVERGDRLGNLATVLARMDQRLVELHNVLAGIDRWVNDEAMHEDVRATVRSASSAAAKLDATMDNVDATVGETKALVTDARGQLDALVRRYIAVADDASATLRTMQQAVELARAGDGTVGKLLNDPGLYNNLSDTAQRLNLAAEELRLLLEKIQKEGLPIQF